MCPSGLGGTQQEYTIESCCCSSLVGWQLSLYTIHWSIVYVTYNVQSFVNLLFCLASSLCHENRPYKCPNFPFLDLFVTWKAWLLGGKLYAWTLEYICRLSCNKLCYDLLVTVCQLQPASANNVCISKRNTFNLSRGQLLCCWMCLWNG